METQPVLHKPYVKQAVYSVNLKNQNG